MQNNFKLAVILVLLFLLLPLGSLQARSPLLGQDKVMHLVTSAYLTYWSYGVSYDIMERSSETSLYFAVSLTALSGTGKELSDRYVKKTRFSWYDMAYNGAGILLGVVLINNLR